MQHFYTKLPCQKILLTQIEWGTQDGPITKFFFYLAFLSGIFTIYGTAGEWGHIDIFITCFIASLLAVEGDQKQYPWYSQFNL